MVVEKTIKKSDDDKASINKEESVGNKPTTKISTAKKSTAKNPSNKKYSGKTFTIKIPTIKKHSTKKPLNKKKSKKVNNNAWMLATIILSMALVALGILNLTTTSNVSVISEQAAGELILKFAASQGVDATLVETTYEGGIYSVTVSVGEQEFPPLYLTGDGKNLINGQLVPLAEIEQASEASTPSQQPTQDETIPTSDKPKVELYVWSYCPYGVQAQGPMAEVASLLEADVDFEVLTYYDGHGAYETKQNMIQACIQKLNPGNYWDYASKFVTDIYPKCSTNRTEECNMEESLTLMKSLNIDTNKILDCVESEGTAMLADYSARAQQSGVTGSPTVMINGVKANVGRTSEAYKTAICSAFNTAPEECETVLSSASAQAASGSC